MHELDDHIFSANSTGFLVNQLARLMTQVLAREIRQYGIAPAQFTILLMLWERDGQSQAELLTEVKVEQATIAVTLDRMERDELIARKPNPKDHRSRLIFLTRKGRSLREPALATGTAINIQTLIGISPAAQRLFIQHLKTAIENSRKALGEIPASGPAVDGR